MKGSQLVSVAMLPTSNAQVLSRDDGSSLANIDQIPAVPLHQLLDLHTTTPVIPSLASPAFYSHRAEPASVPYTKLPTESLRLIALLTNPRSGQRPHDRARGILAYHQFLFRTLHLLFPADHVVFLEESPM